MLFEYFKKDINYVNAPCGSGKTYQLIEHCKKLVKTGHRIVISVPTYRLMNGTIDQYVLDIPVSKIVAGDRDDEESVSKKIREKLEEPYFGGELVFITHEGLKRVPHFVSNNGWNLYVDEAMSVTDMISIELKGDKADEDEVAALQTLLMHCQSKDDRGFSKLSLGRKKKLRRIIDIPDGYEMRKPVHNLAFRLTNPNWDVHVSTESMDGRERLHAHCTLLPSVLDSFVSVTMLAANFEDSEIFKVWRIFRENFWTENVEWKNRLKFQGHDGAGVRIAYLFEADLSANFLKKELDGEKIFWKIVDGIKAKYLNHDDKFLWVQNAKVLNEKDAFSEYPFSKRISSVSHGLNEFQDFHKIIFLAAIRPSPIEIGFKKALLGLDWSDVDKFRYFETVYQSVLRTSLRRNDGTNVEILVMDKSVAEYLQNLLPGSELVKLDLDLAEPVKRGRPKTPIKKSRAEIQKEYRDRKKLSQIDWNQKRYQKALDTLIFSVTESLFSGMQFKTLCAKTPYKTLAFNDQIDFIRYLKTLSGDKLEFKEANHLVSPAFFDPSLSKTTAKGRANVAFCRGIWMDNDGNDHGAMTPDEFANLFPDWQMVIYNSFNSTATRLKYRVFIPTTGPCSKERYAGIQNMIWEKLPDSHGFDPSKRYPESLFYLPCQAADPLGNYWKEYLENRKTMNPDDFTDAVISTERPKDIPRISEGPLKPADIETAIQEWRTTPAGEGNRAFFNLALKLNSAGLGETELKGLLWQEAAYARQPHKRRRQIASVLNSLKSYGKAA